MAYFIYQIQEIPGQLVRKLTFDSKFDDYREAKQKIRSLRDSDTDDSEQYWKIVFADSQLHAEELLQEKREQPVLMEWEK